VAGAQVLHGVDEATAERVFAMVQGFSGFGFPKAHGAAFGLLAYQSTWLRVHYSPEFLCSLLNEQPMGFYPPDALVHEAQRRGIEVLAPDVNLSDAECRIEDGDGLRVRVGLGYVRGVREHEVRELVAAREAAGSFRSLSDLAARSGAGRPSLELLAWAGACDSLVPGSAAGSERRGAAEAPGSERRVMGAAPGSARRVAGATPGSARRVALWQLGVATPGKPVRGGTQLALPLDLPSPPALDKLTRWESMLADYASTGLTVGTHPIALLRARLPPDAVTSRDLETLTHGSRVRIGGLVVARQRPGTANGIVFVLIEDEHGTVNLVVPPALYERERLTVRTEPLVLVAGKLERLPAAGGAINVLVDRIASIAAPDRLVAQVKEFSMLDERERARREEDAAERREERAGARREENAGEDFRAVAPPVMSFASGRRR
jgi:error-prone DNA polymerase